MTKRKGDIDSLDAEIDNPEAILCIMSLYGVDEPTAAELWAKFIGTVGKMKEISEDQRQPEVQKEATNLL
jgi:hypothetical protein